MNPADPAPTQTPSHRTYLAVFLREDGFTRLLLAGLWVGRILKRFNLVRENCMVDSNLLTTTSSLPPISTVLKESRNNSPAQNLALSSPCGWTPCECDVNLSAAPVSLCSDRTWGWRLGGVWLRVCELSGAGMQEGVTPTRTSTHHSHLSPPTPLSGDTPCPHAWWPSTSTPVQTRIFEYLKLAKKYLARHTTVTVLVLIQ